MCIDALSKSLESYDMKDMFAIIPEQAVQHLNTYLDVLFACQTSEADTLEAVTVDSSDTFLVNAAALATRAVRAAERDVEAVEIVLVDLISTFQDLDTSTIFQLNKHYAMYGSEATV